MLKFSLGMKNGNDGPACCLYERYICGSLVRSSPRLCAVVKALPDGPFIITAYYTDTVKRGAVLWEKK